MRKIVVLTERQRRVFDFIVRFIRERGFAPTVRELMEEFGFRSPRTAFLYLRVLEEKGLIKVHRGKARGVEVLERPREGIPLLGRIPAGFPHEPVEDFEEVLPVDPSFFGPGEKFALKVKGDSMIGAGIKDGDIAVIRTGVEPQDGQIAAALYNGEVTLKRLRRRNGRVELLPENPAYKPITAEPSEVQILGVMVGLIRRL